jgi:polyhydroxyalkanoate synthesis regulator phasin
MTQDVVANLAALRERLLSTVTLTPDRIQETVDDAVRRGRMTSRDAEELLVSLVTAGRQQTEALLADVEQLLGLGAARERATRGGDAVRRGVDRARRAAGGSAFPIEDYDALTAGQVNKRLADLTPAELRKVRDHETGARGRKSVLEAIDRRLR